MEYSIQELARLSGVTTRTLRWYDQIGLLKPGRVAENGYRRYGPAQVDRLQDILYYRALGVELAQIRACLDDPDFDRLAALRGHLARLEGERARLDGLIRSVTDTIHAEERNEIMQDEQKFEVFKRQAVECNEALYGREVREKYGDAQMDEANAAVMGLTQEQYRTWTGLGEEIRAGLERAVPGGGGGAAHRRPAPAVADPDREPVRPGEALGTGRPLYGGPPLHRLLRPERPGLRLVPAGRGGALGGDPVTP